MRQALEGAVIEHYGCISLAQTAIVQSVIRAERRARLLERWIRTEEPDLAMRMQMLSGIDQATAARDKAIEKLALPQPDEPPDPSDPATLYIRPEAPRSPLLRSGAEQDSIPMPPAQRSTDDSGASQS